jgi:hypothetical protein
VGDLQRVEMVIESCPLMDKDRTAITFPAPFALRPTKTNPTVISLPILSDGESRWHGSESHAMLGAAARLR